MKVYGRQPWKVRARSSMHFTVCERGRGAFSDCRIEGLSDSRPEVQTVLGVKWGSLKIADVSFGSFWLLLPNVVILMDVLFWGAANFHVLSLFSPLLSTTDFGKEVLYSFPPPEQDRHDKKLTLASQPHLPPLDPKTPRYTPPMAPGSSDKHP